MFHDFVIGLLATPLADPAVTKLFAEHDGGHWAQEIRTWLGRVEELNSSTRFRIAESTSDKWIDLEVVGRESGRLGIRIVEEAEMIRAPGSVPANAIREAGKSSELVLLCVCADQGGSRAVAALEHLTSAAQAKRSRLIVMEPRWTAAITIEHMKPILIDDPQRLGSGSPLPYFEATPIQGTSVEISRTLDPLRSFSPLVIDDPGLYARKARELQSRPKHKGSILLCTTFLPPVTHALTAQLRFYKHMGATDETLGVIEDRLEWERAAWSEHISRHRRIDIIDRAQLEEYLGAPEYYQMPLTARELRDQIARLRGMLANDNYELCLTPEAVDLPFEIRGSEVSIRTDRRNKGQPRQGRIRNLVLRDRESAEVFEREFWSLYRNTEPEFKDKEHILDWLDERQRLYKTFRRQVENRKAAYDVFLCFNSEDRVEVKRVGRRLQKLGLEVWLDEWSATPGRQWVWELEEQLTNIKSAAVFVGATGIGAWQRLELSGFIQQFVERGSPVIPVLLRSARAQPELPPILSGTTWVDFRKRVPNPLEQLAKGIRSAR